MSSTVSNHAVSCSTASGSEVRRSRRSLHGGSARRNCRAMTTYTGNRRRMTRQLLAMLAVDAFCCIFEYLDGRRGTVMQQGYVSTAVTLARQEVSDERNGFMGMN